MVLVSLSGFSQSPTCDGAEPFCAGDSSLTFPNTSDAPDAEPGPNYGCLRSQPNPTWYFLRIDESGSLSFRVKQNTSEDFTGTGLDVDFIAYGPFSNLDICEGATLNASTIVDCSYETDVEEDFDIPNAQAGEFYVLLITNFSNQPGFIQLEQTNTGAGAGTTDCSIVNTTNHCVGDVVSVDATTPGAVRYEWQKDGVLIAGETGPTLDGLTAPDATYNAISYDAANMVVSRFEFILDFHDVPVAENPGDQFICDDNNDGISSIDLSQYDDSVRGAPTPSDFVVSYYLSQTDADAGENALPNPFTNPTPYQEETIYARIENINNTDCFDTTSFVIDVLDGAVANSIPNQLFCDDNNDGFGSFTFSDYNTFILGSQNASEYTISYHLDMTDAENDVNPLPNNYTNAMAYQQETIYTRIENTVSPECFEVTNFTIEVADTPRPNTNPGDLVVCDDVGNDGFIAVDLRSMDVIIINGEAGVSVSYFTDASDAGLNENAIASPTAYTNTSNPQRIYARVFNTISQCFEVVDFQIVVNPIPESEPISDFIECENNTDGTFSFDLESKDPEILNGQSPLVYEVSYHLSQSDADNLTAALSSPYTNTSNPQEIFVAISDRSTGCLISDQSFFIEVQETLEANSDGEPLLLEQCDDFGENDGFALFDLSTLDAEILDGQDPSIYSVNYYFTQADADFRTNPVDKNYENSSEIETLFARVDDFDLSNSQCFATTPVFLRVNRLPVFDLDDQYVFCTNRDGSEVAPIPVLRTNLSSTLYTFEWTFNSEVIAGQTGPTLIPSLPGTYGVTVTDINTLCFRTDIAEVIESSRPSLELEVTSSTFSGNNMITATAVGAGDFEYSLDNGPWQDENVFENVSAGQHLVMVRDKNGCGVESATITVLGYAKFFTPNGDGLNDTWNIVGIDSQPDAKIYIFDRYGKLLKQLSPTSPGWNGTFNGVQMPTNDYWFLIEYNEPSTGRRSEFRSHFTLKR